MLGREFFETFLGQHAGEFADRYGVPHPRIDIVLADRTDFWVNQIVALEPGYGVFRQIKSDRDVTDWAVGYEQITRVVFNTVSGTPVGFQTVQVGVQAR